jgi:hypothetical protein
MALGAAPPRLELDDYCQGTAGSDDVDDSDCLQRWIAAGREAPERKLYAPAGTYLYSSIMPMYSGMHLQCAGARQTVFRRKGGSAIFLQGAPLNNVIIERCAFDVDGSTEDFLAVIDVSPDASATSTNIRVSRNRFYDSAILGTMSPQQRQYILLLDCIDCRVDGNHLSEGGRIKVGRPGRNLVIRDNVVEHANDNAITVVDVNAGTSEDIDIQGNHVVNPKDIGIFFGADGDNEGSPQLTLRRVRIHGNRIEGDWRLACIFGRLPAVSHDVSVRKNVCVKSTVSEGGTTGIRIKRTCNATAPATRIIIERNEVSSTFPPTADTAALDHGGIAISGIHDDLEVTRNIIRQIGPRGMLFRHVIISDAEITGNNLYGKAFDVEGTITGDLQAHSESPTTMAIPEVCQ